MIIKFRLRKNLLYLFVYYISFIIVNYIVDITLAVVFEFEHFYIDLYAISIGNIVGGFVIFLYQRNNKIYNIFQIKIKRIFLVSINFMPYFSIILTYNKYYSYAKKEKKECSYRKI